MRTNDLDSAERLRQLTSELDNFRDIAGDLIPLPGEVPRLAGIDVFGGALPLSGSVGGDHIIYVDFKQRFDLDARMARALEQGQPEVFRNLERCRRMAGIAMVDVAGHRMTDALLAAMLHQAFLVGATYELDICGHITKRLFENLNTRFYQSSGAHKFVALLYGEISEDAMFRFISAGQPFPTVFSTHHDRIMEIDPRAGVSFLPLGMVPSLDAIDRSRTPSELGFKDGYQLNEWQLMGAGDILLLHSDGLVEHGGLDEPYFPHRLEHILRRVKHLGAREVFEAVTTDMLAFRAPSDDISIVVIKLA